MPGRRNARKAKRAFKIVKVGRFDSPEGLKDVVFDDGENVKQVLDKAQITLSDGEEVNDLNGNTIDLDAKVRDGMSLVITGNFKSGK